MLLMKVPGLPPQVRLSRVGSRTALLPRDPHVKPPAARDLVYLAPSPDFCSLDPDNGIPGTAGRRCNGEYAESSLFMLRGCKLRPAVHCLDCNHGIRITFIWSLKHAVWCMGVSEQCLVSVCVGYHAVLGSSLHKPHGEWM